MQNFSAPEFVDLSHDGYSDLILGDADLKSGDWLGRFQYFTFYKYHFPVSVQEDKQLPSVSLLEQNYPNPFNPMTVIRYQVPDLSPDCVGADIIEGVTEVGSPPYRPHIVVSGVEPRRGEPRLRRGKLPSNHVGVNSVEGAVASNVHLAAPVHERKAPGSYKIMFNASHLASGVYHYRLSAGNFVHTRKLIVLS